MSTSNPEVVADHVSDLSSAEKPIFFLSFVLLQTDLSAEVGILYDLIQSRRYPRIKIRELSITQNWWALFKKSSTESTISTSLIHNIASEGELEQALTWVLNLIFQNYQSCNSVDVLTLLKGKNPRSKVSLQISALEQSLDFFLHFQRQVSLYYLVLGFRLWHFDSKSEAFLDKEMNCVLLCDNQRIHIEVLHFVFWLAFELLSQVRVDFLEVWNVRTRYAVIVRPLRVVLVVDVGILCGKFPCFFLKTLFLVRSCSSECPCTFAHLCICSPHLRTWRCVILIWTSSSWFPSTLCYEFRTLLTWCSEYPRATGCTRTQCCRRACCRMRDQVQRRLRRCHKSLSSPVPCCILFDIASEQLAGLKMLILNKWTRLFHSSRVKLPFVNMSASWFLVSTYLTDFWVQGDSVK